MLIRFFCKDWVGVVVGRMFVQVLGLFYNFLQLVVVDCFVDGMVFVEIDSGGGNELLINYNVLYIVEESVILVN